MKRICVALLILILAGCSHKEPITQNIDNESREVAADILDVKIRANGMYLLCDQSGYTKCFNINQAQCLEELSPLVEGCYKQGKEIYGELGLNGNEKQIGVYLASCLFLEHVSMHKSKGYEISTCMENVVLDKNQAVHSLVK